MRAALSMEQGSSPPQVIVFCAIAAFVQLLSIGNNKTEIKKVKQKVKCVVHYVEKKKSETVVIQWKLITLTALYQ